VGARSAAHLPVDRRGSGRRGSLLRQLQWIRDGRRKNANPTMLALIKDLDDKSLAAIADYVSRIPVDLKSDLKDTKNQDDKDKEEK